MTPRDAYNAWIDAAVLVQQTEAGIARKKSFIAVRTAQQRMLERWQGSDQATPELSNEIASLELDLVYAEQELQRRRDQLVGYNQRLFVAREIFNKTTPPALLDDPLV